MKAEERILGKFQCKKGDFGFVIPDEREYWGWDFFVHQKNFGWAEDGQRVAAEMMDRASGKKPEARIVEVFWSKKAEAKKAEAKKYEALKVVEGVYSGWNGDFWFVDVPWVDQWYFCYGLKRNGAIDGDRVKADIKKYNGKEEAIVTEILPPMTQIITWVYLDNDTFGFVKPDDKSGDIFIAGSRKWEAKTKDKVEVHIIKEGGRRREGIISAIL